MARIVTCATAILTFWCGEAMAQVPQAVNQGSTQPTSRTFSLTFGFARHSLPGAIAELSEEIGVPIELVGRELQLHGITDCQSFGIDRQERSLEELLQTMLARANRDNKLVYTVKPNSLGVDTVYITVREEAEKRGEEIFPEFKLPAK